MWSTLYYIFSASAITSIGYGILYYVDRDRAINLTRELSWNSVKLYHKVNLEYKKINRLYCQRKPDKDSKSDIDESDNEDFSDKEEEGNLQFYGYNLGNSHITEYKSFNIDDNDYINNTDFDLMFIKDRNEKIYKRIKDKSDISNNIKIKKIDKPFIQVELCQDNEDENVTIHKNLEPFYTDENEILDKKFLKWYAKTFYDISIEKNYKINIIDSNINMFHLKECDYLKLDSVKNYEIMKE